MFRDKADGDCGPLHSAFDVPIPFLAGVNASVHPDIEQAGLLQRLQLRHHWTEQILVLMAVADENGWRRHKLFAIGGLRRRLQLMRVAGTVTHA
jgi:hypothetical protein